MHSPSQPELEKLIRAWSAEIRRRRWFDSMGGDHRSEHWVPLTELQRLRGWVRRLHEAENDLGNQLAARLAREIPKAVFMIGAARRTIVVSFKKPVARHLDECLAQALEDFALSNDKRMAIAAATHSLLFGAYASKLFLGRNIFRRELAVIRRGRVWLGWSDEDPLFC